MENFKELLKPELIWFIAGLIMLLAEFAMPGLIIFFFGVGAWLVALICLFIDISINIQLIILLTPEPEILEDILATKPGDIRLLSCQTFEILWIAISLEERKLRERTK